MSRNLNEEQSSTLKTAIKGVVDASDKLRTAPRFSTRADNFTDQILRAAEVGKKLLTELGDSPTPDEAPNLPDSGRGDWDTKGERGTVPKGLTSTHSMQPNRDSNARQNQAGNNQPGNERGKINEDGTQTFGGKDPAPMRESLINPGLSGHPVKRDDKERAGNEFTVDSSTHREAARGENTNADTLEGGKKAMEEGGKDYQRQTDPGSEGNPANVSEPFKQGADTTNTSSEGSGKPDNYFAQKGGDANEPKKYDSENRVATETLGHKAEKDRMAKEGGADGGTSSQNNDPFNSENKSSTEKSAADKEQQTKQGDAAAKAATDKPQTPAAKDDAKK